MRGADLLPDYIRANYEMEEAVEQGIRAARALDRALKDMDPKLSVVLVRPNHPGGYGIKPGYWHVCRRNDPPFAHTYWPIQTPDGGFREPDSGVLVELQERDLQRRPELMPKLNRVEHNPGFPTYEFAKDPSAERAKETEDEARREEFRHNLRSAERVAGEGGLTKRKWGRG